MTSPATPITSRIIAFAPSEDLPRDSVFIYELADLCQNLGLKVLRKAPYFVASEISDDQAGFSNQAEHLICDTLPGKIASERSFEFDLSSGWDKWHQTADNQAQLYNLMFCRESEFTIESDVLGLKPLYMANLGFGTLVASKIIDLFKLDKSLIQPVDRMGLAELILTGHPFGSRTLHEKVRRTKTGERIHWSDETKEMFCSRPRRLKISTAVRSDISLNEAIEELDGAITDSLRRRINGALKPLNIGLSGGFDSRILAATLNKMGEGINAFTYGLWHHREVLTAKQTAKALGINHTILPYPLDNHYQREELFLNTLEGQADSSTVQIANLLQMNAPVGTTIMHGFMSDAVAVSNFSERKGNAAPKSLDEAAYNLASSVMLSNAHSQFLSSFLDVDLSVDSITDEIRSDMEPEGLHYHSAVLWDVENRHRRFIAGHLPMLGQKFDVIAPFYDTRLMSIWMTLPRICLDGRYLQRQLLAKLYPELAKIPHSEEVAPILPSLSNQLRLLTDSLIRKKFNAAFQKLVGYRTTNIWSIMGGQATQEQRSRMQKQFVENLDDTDKMLGLSKFRNEDVRTHFEYGPEQGDYLTPRAIYQTSSYARWLRESLS